MVSPVQNSGKQEKSDQYHSWWNQLSDTWKQAFNETLFQQKNIEMPDAEKLAGIFNLTVIRMAGPGAMFPNMSISLEDLSGVSDLVNLEILVVVNHRIPSLKGLSKLNRLHSLFVFGNEIVSLEGIEELPSLKQLFINDNHIDSLLPLSGLVQLETIHCAHNKLVSLEGIGKQHTALKDFFCLPNNGIWSSEVMRFESEFHIRCQKG
jgi:hypothetical protein